MNKVLGREGDGGGLEGEGGGGGSGGGTIQARSVPRDPEMAALPMHRQWPFSAKQSSPSVIFGTP